MPSGSRSKEDTWKADDLGTALRGKKDDRRRSDDRKRSDKDVRERRKTDKDEDRDRKERKHRENADADHKDRVRDKDRDRDREKDRDRRDREKGGKEKDRSERHRSKQDPENGERRRDDRKKTNDEKSGSREQVNASRSSEDRRHRRHRDDGERRSEDKERHRRTRDEDEGREKKHRSHREREEEGGKSRRHRDGDVEKKHSKDEQGEDRKHRSHRDRDPDRNKQRPSNKDSTTHTKSQPDVTKEKKKADKIPTETKVDESSSSSGEKVVDITQEVEDMSEESKKWRQRVAVAAESRERHSSQECVRASSSSMSGDILEDFSFSDDGEQIGSAAQVGVLSEHMQEPSSVSEENLAKLSSGTTGAIAELTEHVVSIPAVPLTEESALKTRPKLVEKTSEVKPKSSVGKATVKKSPEAEHIKGKSIKLTGSKAGHPETKGCTGSGTSVSSTKNNSSPKTDKRRASCDSGNASTPTKGHTSKKSLTKKVYSNAGSSLPHSPGRKDSVKQNQDRSDVTNVSPQQQMSQRRNSAPSAVQEKKPKTATQPLASTKAVTKPMISPHRASTSIALRREKSSTKEKKLPSKSGIKEVVQDVHKEKEKYVQKADSHTDLRKKVLATEDHTTVTTSDGLPTCKTSLSKIGHHMTLDAAEVQSLTKPVVAGVNRCMTVDHVRSVDPAKLAAEVEVIPAHVLKEDATGSKAELDSSRKQEDMHNTSVNIIQKIVSTKDGEKVSQPANKNATHKLNSGQKVDIENNKQDPSKAKTHQRDSINETQQQSSNSDVCKGKSEMKKVPTIQDTISVLIKLPATSKEKLEQNQSSAKPKDQDVPYKEKLAKKEDLTVKVSPRVSTPMRHQREDTPVPEQVPTICKSVRCTSSVHAQAVSALAATPHDKTYAFIASPDENLKEHSSCETIPDDESDGCNSLDLVRRTLKKKKKKEELNEGNDEYNYDEEEFEDYDDDFEDDDEDEENASDRDEGNCNEASNDTQTKTSAPKNDMDELLSALDKENERLLHSAKNKRSTDPSGVKEQPIHREIDQGADNRRTFINFSSAKKSHMSSVAASKARCRGNDLLKMIELDVAHYELFDMPPVNEYELYMRTFGCSNTRQAYVQTHDDNLECETQTEVTECTDKWSQHPPEDFNCTGGDEDPKESDELERKPIDAVKLGKFIHNASQVITMLLEEEYSEISTRNGPIKNQSNFVLSESFIQLETSDITKDRHVAFSYFSPLQTKYLLTAYSRPHTIHPEDRLSSSGLIFVWNVGEPSQPEKVLVCESQPQCCCFSPGQATLVFAGMHDGSLTVWDLSESSSLHRPHTIGGQDWLLRYPTYNTAGVLHHENHHSSVVQVTPIVAAGDSTQASLNGVIGTGGGGGGSEGMSFQLASLEEQAIIHLWVVAEIMHPDPAGSESDLGLLPGGRVKLVKSSSIKLENPTRTPTLQSAMQALDLCLLPQNNSHFYVATDTGSIIHGVRYGGKAPPKAYRPQTEGLMRVTSLDFSPFCEPTFLAGCADGSLSLYTTESEYPLMTWPEATENATPIVWVRWCRSRPSVFFVLDSNAFLYIWDLLMDDLIPLKQEKVADARVTSFALSNDYTATGCGTPGRKPQMVMSLENGATEVHSISREFSAMMPDEVNQFSQYLQKVV